VPRRRSLWRLSGKAKGSMPKKGRGGRRTRREDRRRAVEEARVREKEARVTREVAGRALWRLNVLEYLILLSALLLSLAGGALVAWVLGVALGAPFRMSWAAASLLLFIVPGAFVYLRELRRERDRNPPT
jgi:hypothetical protein